jgi:hypothetical protein
MESKYCDDVIGLYNFNDDQLSMLKELMSAKICCHADAACRFSDGNTGHGESLTSLVAKSFMMVIKTSMVLYLNFVHR